MSKQPAPAALLATTPASGPHRSIGFVAAVATLGSFLFGYDTGVISGAQPYMYLPEVAGGLALGPWQEGMVGGSLLLGAALGALVGGRLSDRFGRRHNILTLAVIFTVGALGTALSPNLALLYLARFVLGTAVGGASATVPVYLAETAPKRIRGTIVAIDQLMIVTGQLAAFSCNAVINLYAGGPQVYIAADPSGRLTPGWQAWDNVSQLAAGRGGTLDPDAYAAFVAQLQFSAGNGQAWRWMLLLCTVPAIALWLGMRLMPESPRWYAANGRYIEAVAALKRIRDPQRDDLAAEVAQLTKYAPAAGPAADPAADPAPASDTTSDTASAVPAPGASFATIWSTPWLRKLFAIGVFLAVCNQTTGVNTVMYYAPKVLEFAGMGARAAIMSQVANGVMSVIGAAIGLVLIGKLRRRTILIGCIIGVAACMYAISGLFTFAIAPHLDGGTIPPAWAAIAVLAVMGAFMLIVQAANGPVVWTMLGEMFPSHVRGVATGAAVFAMWIVNGLITVTFPPLLETLGGGGTYLLYALLNTGIAAGLWRVMPETSGLSLEELEAKFERDYTRP